MDDDDYHLAQILQLGGIAIQGIAALANLDNLAQNTESLAINRQPKHNSAFTGQAYTNELLSSGHHERILECLHMPAAVFLSFCQLLRKYQYLKDTRYTTVEHQVHIFIYVITTGGSNRTTQERFMHSGETISRIFRNVLNAVNRIADEFIRLPSMTPGYLNQTPVEIYSNPKFFPFFKDCIGAIDGSLIPLNISANDAAANRTRKGFTAQNAFVACSFDCRIQFVLAGWEGSAHDSQVLADACSKGFIVPNGKYYLADGGYAISPQFLTPYRGVRYHLREQVVSGLA